MQYMYVYISQFILQTDILIISLCFSDKKILALYEKNRKKSVKKSEYSLPLKDSGK